MEEDEHALSEGMALARARMNHRDSARHRDGSRGGD